MMCVGEVTHGAENLADTRLTVGARRAWHWRTAANAGDRAHGRKDAGFHPGRNHYRHVCRDGGRRRVGTDLLFAAPIRTPAVDADRFIHCDLRADHMARCERPASKTAT